jgi:hypothetical protein
MSYTKDQLIKKIKKDVNKSGVSISQYAKDHYKMPAQTLCDFLAKRIPHVPKQVLEGEWLEKKIHRPAAIIYVEKK